MAKNRSIEAKRIKYIKQVRARPRNLKMNNGYIKAPQANSKDHIPKDARSLFEYRERAKIKGDEYVENFVTAIIDTMFPNHGRPVPKERPPQHIRLTISQPVKRELIIQNNRYVRLVMLTNRDFSCVEFAEWQLIPGILRRSITYSSYDRAMKVHHLGTIKWKTTYIIPDVESIPSVVDT